MVATHRALLGHHRSSAPLLATALLSAAGVSCEQGPFRGGTPSAVVSQDSSEATRRDAMVAEAAARGIREPRVLEAMRSVPRHRFVPDSLRPLAYSDRPLPLGRGQTISQPAVVALMAEALQLRESERVLELGSGSGYAAAVLSLLAGEVYGVELEQELCDRSVATLRDLGYRNVHVKCGDGFHGWPEHAPFDAVVVSFAVDELPAPVWNQLRQRGRAIYPRGNPGEVQQLTLVTKTAEGRRERLIAPVQFVPMRRGR